jgi:16S rRNA (cytosine967-C5)-methyltransferase
MTARLAAARVLIALERGRTTLSREIEEDRSDLQDARDRGLLLEIVAGVLRWQAALDACLATRCTRPIAGLAPEVRAVLRAGAYQLLYLDRLPPHAVVHESVEVVRQLKHSRAAGFVNAVLRGLLRGGDARKVLPAKPTAPDDRDAALDYLSVTLSHPRWLAARWLDRFGFDAAARWCEFNNTSPAVTIRPMTGDSASVLLHDLTERGVAAALSPFAPESIRLPAGSLGRLDEELRRRIVVQDEGSQMVALAAGAAPGLRVLDVCAAPGGKTALLQLAVAPGGLVIAGDHRPARVRLLQSRLRALGVAAPVLALDAGASLPFADVFDRVLLDAPCSGLGTLRRDPDLKWTRTLDDLARFAEAQLRMIKSASAAVRPGGTLTYATCSSEPDENEAVVEQFLHSTPEFHRAAVTLPSAQAPAARLVDESGFLHTFPFRDEVDAFFAARLVRSPTA